MSRKNKYKYNNKKISIKENNKQTCDIKCIHFPQDIDKEVEYIIKKGVKYRANKVSYICGYDGHQICKFSSHCPHKRTFEGLKSIWK
jgi:hypothetical protein